MAGSIQKPNGRGGVIVLDVIGSSRDVLAPFPVNALSALKIPAYRRAIEFKCRNMASFERSVRKDGIDVKHPLNKILQRKPNGYQDATTFWGTLHFHRHHYANGYAEIVRDSQLNVVALHNRLPEFVFPYRWIDDDGEISQWYWVQQGKQPHAVPFQDMIHLAGTSWEGMSGIPPLMLFYESLERAAQVGRFITRFLVKGGVIRGSVEIPSSVPEAMQETVVNRIREQCQGVDATDDVLVLSDGAAFKNGGLSNDQSQLVQLASYSTKEIAQQTDVDPYWLFDRTETKYASTADASQNVVKFLFRLLCEEAEDQMLKLLPEAEQDEGYYICVDPRTLLRGDLEAEGDYVSSLATSGLITANEARQEIGYEPSSDPNAEVLKVSGDTSPQISEDTQDEPEPEPEPEPPKKKNNSKYHALIEDVANRVGTKTTKATETAIKKHGTGADFTTWGNVFSQSQEKYASESLAPILSTMDEPEELASKIGSKYGFALRQHYAALVRGQESQEPRLAEIFTTTLEGKNDEN